MTGEKPVVDVMSEFAPQPDGIINQQPERRGMPFRVVMVGAVAFGAALTGFGVASPGEGSSQVAIDASVPAKALDEPTVFLGRSDQQLRSDQVRAARQIAETQRLQRTAAALSWISTQLDNPQLKSWLKAAGAKPSTRSTSKPAVPGSVSHSATTNDQKFLACTRAHESDTAGGYQAVSPNGLYYGAYQFLPSTWNKVAVHAGRPDLVGVRPDHAAPADQDALALDLYHWQGKSPWGGRC